nr:cation-transporting P-type ATPase [Spiroplasma sp. AdecLV25b]
MKRFLNKIHFKLQFSFKKDLVYKNGDHIKTMAQANQKTLLNKLELKKFGLNNDQIETRTKKYGNNVLKKSKIQLNFRIFKSIFWPI